MTEYKIRHFIHLKSIPITGFHTHFTGIHHLTKHFDIKQAKRARCKTSLLILKGIQYKNHVTEILFDDTNFVQRVSYIIISKISSKIEYIRQIRIQNDSRNSYKR